MFWDGPIKNIVQWNEMSRLCSQFFLSTIIFINNVNSDLLTINNAHRSIG